MTCVSAMPLRCVSVVSMAVCLKLNMSASDDFHSGIAT